MNEQYKCGSYFEDGVLKDCTCGWCELEDYLVGTLIGDLAEREFTARLITKRIKENYTPKDQVQAECEEAYEKGYRKGFADCDSWGTENGGVVLDTKAPKSQDIEHLVKTRVENFKKEQRHE